jgi:hypothetical protein
VSELMASMFGGSSSSDKSKKRPKPAIRSK